MTVAGFAIEELIHLALRAGAAVLEIYQGPFDATLKADSSPVTDADMRAEAIILAGLARLAPDIPVIAEEEVAAGRVPAAAARFFLVDPLDGTKEFIGRNGEFTVNIAVVENGEPVAGVVYAPAKAEIYYAGHGGPAMHARVADGGLVEEREIHTRKAPAEGLIAVASRSHRGAETEAYLARFPITDLVSAGSSLKFCIVAAGHADIYPRLGRTMEWDTAAGDAILRAAGGRVVTLDGASLAYGKRGGVEGDLANPYFVVLGDSEIALGAGGACTAPGA